MPSSGWGQLSKKAVPRTAAFYGYLAFIFALVVAANIWAWPYDAAHPDSVVTIAYLVVGGAALNLAHARIDRGGLTLALLLNGAGTLLVNPLNATLMGGASQIFQPRRGAWRLTTNAIITGAMTCLGSLIAAHFRLLNFKP